MRVLTVVTRSAARHSKHILAVGCLAAGAMLWGSARAEDGGAFPTRLPTSLAPFCVFTSAPEDPVAEPLVYPIPMRMRQRLAEAIWGSTGRDARGHIWFGVSMRMRSGESACLLEYIPETGEMIERGNVVAELERLGLYRGGEGQAKIHTKIIQAADGHLYFASTDLTGGDFLAGTRPPTWGSHLWRLRLPENEWEHLLSMPEGAVTTAGTGNLIYACGLFGHKLYQYNTTTGQVRSVQVGSVDAHFTRNIFTDRNDHVYVPRLRRSDQTGETIVTLVEYDTELNEVAQRPMPQYVVRSPNESHGITAFQPMADGSIVFVTSIGFLYRLIPHDDGPADLVRLGWFHPDGPRYVASMFTYAGERYVMGLSTGSHDKERGPRDFEWVVYDLEEGTSTPRPLRIHSPGPFSTRSAVLYGCVTRDDEGRFYIVGRSSGRRPLILQAHCP